MNLLLVLQIIVACILIFLTLIQSQGSGLGKSFASSTAYRSRKGMEKGFFLLTIVMAILFAAVSLANILL